MLLVLQALAAGVTKSEHEPDHPIIFSVEAKNEWSHASVWLHDLPKDMFT